MSSSDSSDQEQVRDEITITRYGRKSIPVKTLKSSNKNPATMATSVGKTEDTAGTSRDIRISAEEYAYLLEIRNRENQANSNDNKVNAISILNSDSIPCFRGFRRKNDPPFEETQDIRTHISSLKAYIGTLSNPSEQDKKQLLLRSADNNVGDFKQVVTHLVNANINEDMRFQDMLKTLENIYVGKSTKTIADLACDILDTECDETENIASNLVTMFHKFDECSRHICDETIYQVHEQVDNLVEESDVPGIMKLIRSALVNMLFLIKVGTKITDEARAKIMSGPLQSGGDLLATSVQVIRETPSDKSVLKPKRKANARVGIKVNETYSVETGNIESADNFKARTLDRDSNVVERGYRGSVWRNNFRGRGRGYYNRNSRYEQDSSRVDRDNSKPVKCYNCNKFGHFAKDCRLRKPVQCHRCGELNHVAKSCKASADKVKRFESKSASKDKAKDAQGNFLE